MVKPVELQDALGKTQAVERIAQLQKANPENEQRQAIQSAGQKTEDAHRKPPPAAHSDEVVLHRDSEREKENKKKQQQSDRPARQADTTKGVTDDEALPPPELDITV
jgi:hypothetical protein